MTPKEQLRLFFKTDYPLNQEGLEELLNAFELQSFQKKTVILREGKVEKQLRFLVKGNIREFYATEEKEININFYTQAQFVNDFSSFKKDKPTRKNQETLTDVDLLVLDKIIFRQLLQKYQCGQSFIDLTFQKLLEERETFEYQRITQSFETLYQNILENKSNWLQEIPQYHIASYLGITPETLSRIRKRMLS